MKLTRSLRYFLSLNAVVLLGCSRSMAQTNFSFTLPTSYHTSAGVYTLDQVLVRTLWSDSTFTAGAHRAAWDNKDDDGKVVDNAAYQIKVLFHNVKYIWDGSIANTSRENSGPTVYRALLPIRGMVANDTAVFFITGYNENFYALHYFNKNDARVQTNFGRRDTYVSYGLMCSDEQRIYLASNEGGYGEGAATSFIFAINIKDHSEYPFVAGESLPLNKRDKPYERVIDLDRTSAVVKEETHEHPFLNNAPSGMSVQENGNVLAVSHYGLGYIQLFDKITGNRLGQIPYKHVSALSFTKNGDLWAIADDRAVLLSDVNATPKTVTEITGLQHGLAISADPQDQTVVLIADGGASQQVKAFSNTGKLLWTLGELGGYEVNGSAVSPYKFWFKHYQMGETTFITVLNDHSFWVGDIGNNRSLHFSPARQYKEQIMYQPLSYSCSVDQNDPTRVFNEFNEYKVDYSKPIRQSWTYIKNWAPGLGAAYRRHYNGLKQVTTLSNGKTYAFINNTLSKNVDLVEVGGNFLRATGTSVAKDKFQRATLMKDGSLLLVNTKIDKALMVEWYKRSLTGFSPEGNPIWSEPVIYASVSAAEKDPLPRFGGFGDIKAPITSSGVLVSFDQSKHVGWHLGGIKPEKNEWLWKVSPSGPLDGKGSFDIKDGVNYAGNSAMVCGRNIVYGYHGEFWKQSQAGQFMHFYDDGLFVGQFGVSSHGQNYKEGAIAGFAGNAFSPNLVSVNGELYLWVNDENANGPQRWHLSGAREIKELSGSGKLNHFIRLK